MHIGREDVVAVGRHRRRQPVIEADADPWDLPPYVAVEGALAREVRREPKSDALRLPPRTAGLAAACSFQLERERLFNRYPDGFTVALHGFEPPLAYRVQRYFRQHRRR